MRKAILINFIAKYSNVFIQILLTMILARLVTPKEYGVIAVITVFITFFNIIGDIGVAPAIIQYKDLNEDNLSDIFKFMFLIAVSMSIIFWGFSYLIAAFFKNSIYVNLGHLLCLAIFFNLLSIVPNGLSLRNKNFTGIAISSVVSNFVAGIIAVLLAYNSFGVYALAINAILQAIVKFISIYYLSGFKLKKTTFSVEPIKRIRSFSIYQFLFNLVNYFTRNLDNLIVGKFLGAQALGYYDKAYKLMLYPVQSLTFVVTPVLQPYLSDYQNNGKVIFKYYMSIIKVLALIGIYLTSICFFSSKEIIYIFFGPSWLDSVGSFRALSISIALQMVLSSIGSIFQATNNTKYLFYTGFFSFICFTILGFVGVLIGRSIEWVSILLVVGFIINFLQSYHVLMRKVFPLFYWDFWKQLVKPLVIQIGMVIAFYVFDIDFHNYMIGLIAKIMYGSIIYVVLLYLTGEIVYLRNIFRFKRKKVN